MKWMLAFLGFVWPVVTGFFTQPAPENYCNCPTVSQLSQTGKTTGSVSWSWNGPEDATAYEVWYHRQEGNYTSPRFTVSGRFHTFTNLSQGHYTFYFGAVCGEDTSPFIGSDDIIVE